MAATATKPKPVQKKTVQIKPLILVRVRCAVAHKDPWLKRLYVLWAPVDPTQTDPKTAKPPVFNLAQSDSKGYLSPLKTDLDPNPQKTVPLAEGAEYLFYFVRHPDDALPRAVMADVNAGKRDKWGEPTKMPSKRKDAGKAKDGKPIVELTFEIPESADSYIPKGSTLYEKWVLFRDMPCSQCDAVIKQVKRLQYHLGALRYPIGNHGHPYTPQLYNDKGKPITTQNPGQFDVALWNGVLAFQRDVAAGSANQVPQAVIARTVGAAEPFEPVADAAKEAHQLETALAYGDTADDSPISPAAVTTDYPTVVDAVTGDAVKDRLAAGHRKPGPILLSPETIDTYMSSAMLTAFKKWTKSLKDFGFSQGIRVSNIFREPRIGVVTGGGGISTSLHKSGFAMDLKFDGQGKGDANWGDPHPDYPLRFSSDPANTPATGSRWMVYAQVPISSIPSYMVQLKDTAGEVARWVSPKNAARDPIEDTAEKGIDGAGNETPPASYFRTIVPWKFDPKNANGGSAQPPLTIEGSAFLDFTRIARYWRYKNISAHGGSNLWKYRAPLALTLDHTNIGTYAERLKAHLDPQRDAELPPATTFTIDGATVTFAEQAATAAFLSTWTKTVGRFNAGPDLHCEPHTKEGQALIKALRENAKLWKGRQFHLNRGAPHDPPELDIDITAKTVFPTTPFDLYPITTPTQLRQGSKISFPEYLGNAGHLEWWHFQYRPGYEGKKWKSLLESIGWTEEGLLGKDGGKYIYGLYGIGYSTKDLAADAN